MNKSDFFTEPTDSSLDDKVLKQAEIKLNEFRKRKQRRQIFTWAPLFAVAASAIYSTHKLIEKNDSNNLSSGFDTEFASYLEIEEDGFSLAEMQLEDLEDLDVLLDTDDNDWENI